MHLHKTYMYINFQLNRVCKSVKTVHTNLFAKIASCMIKVIDKSGFVLIP